MEIDFPPFNLRPYQKPLWQFMLKGGRRAVIVWHRRAGKELMCFSVMVLKSMQRIGSYVYFFPSTRLGRRILWDGRTKDGMRFLDIIPKQMIKNLNAVEMKITLHNGSIIQIIGTDQILNVGINPIGCVFSEYSLQSPDCYNFVRPILRENDGWAIFNFTPRGRNHAYEMFLNAKQLNDWFVEKLNVDDTKVLTPEDIEKERAEGMSEELVQQEYFCSFDQGVEGSVYGNYLNKAMVDERITNVPFDPDAKVETAWDLGWDDETVILFFQKIGQEIHIINMLTQRKTSIHDYALLLQEYSQRYGYDYARHFAPHDIKVTEMGTGFSRWEQARNAGIFFDIVPNVSIQEGIEVTRGIWPKLWIDEEKCRFLIKSVENYHYAFNEKNKIHSPKPVHDWSSHCLTGDTEILTRYGIQRIKDLPHEGEILTLYGWSKYICPRITRKNAQLVEVKFKDGTKVKCTPDHLFLTENGWKYAKNLKQDTKIQSYSRKESNISNLNCLKFSPMKNIWHVEEIDYIEPSGNRLLGKFLKNVIYITEMVIQKITNWTIWNVFRHQNMPKYQLVCEKNGLVFLKKHKERQDYGIHRKREDCGIKDMLKDARHGQNGKENLEIVCGVIKNFLVLFVQEVINKNIVTQTAKHPIIESVNEINETSDVWCLSVPEIEHFSLSNGAIVHNCNDALRYLSLACRQTVKGRMSEEDAIAMERAWLFKRG